MAIHQFSIRILLPSRRRTGETLGKFIREERESGRVPVSPSSQVPSPVSILFVRLFGSAAQAVPGAVALASGNRNPALEAEGRVTPAPVCCYCRWHLQLTVTLVSCGNLKVVRLIFLPRAAHWDFTPFLAWGSFVFLNWLPSSGSRMEWIAFRLCQFEHRVWHCVKLRFTFHNPMIFN